MGETFGPEMNVAAEVQIEEPGDPFLTHLPQMGELVPDETIQINTSFAMPADIDRAAEGDPHDVSFDKRTEPPRKPVADDGAKLLSHVAHSGR